jgi:hypothetical protein
MSVDTAEPTIRRANNGAPLRSLDGAVEMYLRGMNITQIALALGYSQRSGSTSGCERISRYLEAAGVRKIRRMK